MSSIFIGVQKSGSVAQTASEKDPCRMRTEDTKEEIHDKQNELAYLMMR